MSDEENASAGTGQDPPAESGMKQVGEFREIPVDAVDPSPLNRLYSGDEDQRVLSLAAELAERGLLHPINVRVMPAGRYEIICGEGRWRAFRHNGSSTIPALVHDCDEISAHVMRLSENLSRNDLEPLDEGAGVAALLKLHNGDVKEVAARVKWDASWVRRRAKLVDLTPAWREEIAKSNTLYPHIRDKVTYLEEIAALPVETQDALLADGALQHKTSAAELRRAIAMWLRRLDAKPWTYAFDKDTYSGSSGRRCESCLKRTGKKDGGLFDGLVEASTEISKGGKSDLYLDPACWEEKTVRFVQTQIADHPRVYFLADDLMYGQKEEERYGQKILPKWQYAECVAGKPTPPAFTVAARGVFVCGGRVGKVVDIKLREEEVDQADDAERSERLAQAQQEEAQREARSEAIEKAVDAALPLETPGLDIRTLLSFGLWFGLSSNRYDEGCGEYAEWDVLSMAWKSLREDLAGAIENILESGYRDDADDSQARNHHLIMATALDCLGIDLEAVRARAEELLHAPAD